MCLLCLAKHIQKENRSNRSSTHKELKNLCFGLKKKSFLVKNLWHNLISVSSRCVFSPRHYFRFGKCAAPNYSQARDNRRKARNHCINFSQSRGSNFKSAPTENSCAVLIRALSNYSWMNQLAGISSQNGVLCWLHNTSTYEFLPFFVQIEIVMWSNTHQPFLKLKQQIPWKHLHFQQNWQVTCINN